MPEAWVNGKPASLPEAVTAAAEILRRARQPVLAGLGTDMAGTRAAILLAEKLGGVFDHMHAPAVLADLDVTRSAGAMVTTPNEARLRADTVLVVGAEAAQADLLARLLARTHPAHSLQAGARRVICVGAHRLAGDVAAQCHAVALENLPAVISALHCGLHGRRCGPAPLDAATLAGLARDLLQARFGVIVWSLAEIARAPMLGFMLADLVATLNETTRFSALPIAPPSNGAGVVQTAAWMTGFPMRTSFARGYPEHDPWRFDAARMAAQGEADAALWISAYEDAAPPWAAAVPLVALTGAATAFGRDPEVRITVGRPGRDHAGVDLSPETGTFAPFAFRVHAGIHQQTVAFDVNEPRAGADVRVGIKIGDAHGVGIYESVSGKFYCQCQRVNSELFLRLRVRARASPSRAEAR